MTTLHSSTEKQVFLAALGVDWQQRPFTPESALAALLAQPDLDHGGKATVVQAMGVEVLDVCMAHGYHSMDLLVLHPQAAGLEEALPHTHAGDEVRYILDGEGLYGFFDAEGQECLVPVRAGDFVRIPAGIEHRFTLTAARRIKALRLFSETAGWVAQYTGRPVQALELFE